VRAPYWLPFPVQSQVYSCVPGVVCAVILTVMAQPSDLEARVSALETEVRDLTQRVRRSEQDAAAARVLAGGADRDVTDMRTEIRQSREQNARMLNALRQDMIEGFARVDERFGRVDERFARVDGGFAEMRGRLDAAAAGLQQITGMLTTLINRDQPDAG
jgi:chromosome segregation ATPase